jgi:hypothetical protein
VTYLKLLCLYSPGETKQNPLTSRTRVLLVIQIVKISPQFMESKGS